jgi:Fur family ferric uptake transcriptional regulator
MADLSVADRGDAILRDLGCRVTGPRREVARLVAGKQGSFSAESVNEELPDIGRATVFRTIKLLADAGIICKTALPDGSPRYSFDHSLHHHHSICSSCGRVEEFRNSALERLLCEMSSEISGQILGHRVELYVTCTRCLRHATPAGHRSGELHEV